MCCAEVDSGWEVVVVCIDFGDSVGVELMELCYIVLVLI
jgi:hypothetical protein